MINERERKERYRRALRKGGDRIVGREKSKMEKEKLGIVNWKSGRIIRVRERAKLFLLFVFARTEDARMKDEGATRARRDDERLRGE